MLMESIKLLYSHHRNQIRLSVSLSIGTNRRDAAATARKCMVKWMTSKSTGDPRVHDWLTELFGMDSLSDKHSDRQRINSILDGRATQMEV